MEKDYIWQAQVQKVKFSNLLAEKNTGNPN